LIRNDYYCYYPISLDPRERFYIIVSFRTDDTTWNPTIRRVYKDLERKMIYDLDANIKCLSDTDAIGKLIKEWLSKCDKLRPLDTRYNDNYFDHKMKYYIDRCKSNKNLKPISFDKLKESNPDVCRTIKGRLKV
jgi:hypothetical protein